MKFRLRNLTSRIPLLERMRRGILVAISVHGTRFFCGSYRVIKVVAAGACDYMSGNKNALFALYHGHMVGLPRLVADRRKLTILISHSRDGEMIARAVQRLGFSTARGSPAFRAVEGGLQMIRAAARGQHLVVTVDGPRGPQYKVKPGIMRIAQLTGLPVIPWVCSVRTLYRMWGWDRFLSPLWATPLLYVVGEPIHVPPDAGDGELERLRTQLENTMDSMRQLADRYWDLLGTPQVTKKIPLAPKPRVG